MMLRDGSFWSLLFFQAWLHYYIVRMFSDLMLKITLLVETTLCIIYISKLQFKLLRVYIFYTVTTSYILRYTRRTVDCRTYAQMLNLFYETKLNYYHYIIHLQFGNICQIHKFNHKFGIYCRVPCITSERSNLSFY